MKLNDLSPAEGSTKKRMRVGRGVGSGKGKTAGRGVKGQNARSGVAVNGFEGGQMPIYMRLPKRGFTAPSSKTHAWVNLGRIAKAVEAGNLSVNSHSSVRYNTPFGGFKQSGLGRELGPDAPLNFTETKNVFFAVQEAP